MLEEATFRTTPMNSTSSRLLVVALCLGSAAAGYFIGQSGGTPRTTVTQSVTTTSAARETESTAEARGVDAFDRQKGERPKVRDIVLQARAAMSGGMSAFMNMRGMLRALAPFADLNAEELQQALAEIEQTVKEPQQKMMFYSMLLSQWAETDGAAAMAYAKEKLQGQGPMMSGVTMGVVGTWARHDPEAVWKWYLQTRDSGERTPMGGPEGYLTGIFGGLASGNLDTAFARLATLQDHEKQAAMQGISISAMDPRNRDALLARASSLDADLRGSLYRSLASSWMMTDPDGAIGWIDTLPADERKGVVAQAGGMLMWSDPARGAELQLKNADEKSLPQTYASIAGTWAARDPQAAAEWLNKQPAGPQLDNARQTFAFTIAERDPAGAFEWAKAITDDNSRQSAYETVYQRLRGKSAERAEAALDAARLPADVAAKIRERGAAKQAEVSPAPVRVR
jgi:hypothetical protein